MSRNRRIRTGSGLSCATSAPATSARGLRSPMPSSVRELAPFAPGTGRICAGARDWPTSSPGTAPPAFALGLNAPPRDHPRQESPAARTPASGPGLTPLPRLHWDRPGFPPVPSAPGLGPLRPPAAAVAAGASLVCSDKERQRNTRAVPLPPPARSHRESGFLQEAGFRKLGLAPCSASCVLSSRTATSQVAELEAGSR